MGGNKAGGRPHHSLSPFPPLPLSIPPKFSDKPVGGKVRSSEGEVPRLPPTNTTLEVALMMQDLKK